MKDRKPRVVLVGGGTGGHSVPIFEIYKKLTRQGQIEVRIIGSGTEVEKRFFKDVPGYSTIYSGKLHRRLTVKNITETAGFIVGLIQSLIKVALYKPDLIFAKGGYVSLPVLAAAKFFRIPYFIHESDIEMGLVNKLAAKGANKIFVGFPAENYKVPAEKVVFSGPIIREKLTEVEANKSSFGFSGNQPIILVTGGSQGSLRINRTIAKIIEDLIPNYNIIHQTGASDFEWVANFKSSLTPSLQRYYYVSDFLSQENGHERMVEAIKIADLVIARAGANTTAELAREGKPVILIPYKHASGDHQAKNAKIFSNADAAIVITDDELRPALLKDTIYNLFSEDGKRLKDMSEKINQVFPNDGLKTVCDEITKFVLNSESEWL